MTRLKLLLALLLCASAHCHAITCDELKAQIDEKIKAIATPDYSLTVVDLAATAPGRVVGSCENGTKKIMYLPGPPAPGAKPGAASAPAAADGIVTECKPGYGGADCKTRVDRP